MAVLRGGGLAKPRRRARRSGKIGAAALRRGVARGKKASEGGLGPVRAGEARRRSSHSAGQPVGVESCGGGVELRGVWRLKKSRWGPFSITKKFRGLTVN